MTLTATSDAVAGQDITIPFTISDSSTAGSDEYTIVGDPTPTSIVISAGSSTGSITITASEDDTDVEIMETIIFTIGDMAGLGTTVATDVTLNLDSDDNPVVNSIVASPTSFGENESTTVTATISAASSKDTTIPLTLSGTATSETDFTSSFASEGVETLELVVNSNNNTYQNFLFYDGKYLFVDGSTLRVFDPQTETNTNYSLNNYFDSPAVLEGDLIYGRSGNSIHSYDISDLNNITTTELVATTSPINISGGLTVSDGIIYYQIYQNITGVWKTYKKETSADPVEIGTGDNYNGFFMLNSKLYAWNGSTIYENQNNEFINTGINGNDAYENSYRVINGQLYFRDQQSSPYNVSRATIGEGPGGADGELTVPTITYSQLNYNLSEGTNQIQGFDIDSSGNLLLYNQSTQGVLGVFSYQLSPEIKISAGSTTGSITFTGLEDALDEVDETIILTPGTVSNATLTDTSDIELTILDTNDPPVITFAFSASAINEGSTDSVTLTATSDAVAGQDITIPFTISDSSTAGSDEYTIVGDPTPTSIVISAGSSTGSITITASENDTDVEIMETIIFTIGDMAGLGTTEATEVTLNLESDDNPVVNTIVASPTSFGENESTTVTATISAASSRDVKIPLTFSGTAIEDTDYTNSFETSGEKTTVSEDHTNYGKMKSHDDGRLFFMNSNTLRVYDPSSDVLTERILSRSFNYFSLVSNILYGQTSQKLYALDITDLDNITEEVIIDLSGTPQGGNFNYPISFEGNNMLYNVLDGTNNPRKVYKKTGNEDPVLLSSGTNNNCCYAPLLFNDRALMIESGSIYELIDGTFTYLESFGNLYIDRENIEMNNGDVYAHLDDYSDSISAYVIAKLNLDNIDDGNTSNGSFDVLPNVVFTQLQNIVSFSFSNNNLYTNEYNNNTGYGLYTYQLSPEIKIAAGSTTGSITFTGLEDALDEVDETIILTPGTVSNATLTDTSDIELTILDTNDPPVITFALSAATINEGTSESVALTATSDAVAGQDITIPFTISDSSTAGSDEYTIVGDPTPTSIVISAGSSTGSITITASEDDTDVEIMETIIFTIGDMAGLGTTEDTDVTLNLQSEDEPNSSLSATNPNMDEGESTSITLTLDNPTSQDVTIPLVLTGTAEFEIDYTTDFLSKGEEELLVTVNDNYQDFDVLPDGRFIVLNYSTLEVRESSSSIVYSHNISDYYNYMEVSGDYIYLKSNSKISRVNVTDLLTGETLDMDGNPQTYTDLTLTTLVDSSSLGPNDYFEADFSVEDETMVYQVYDWPSGRQVYKKVGENEPELLYEGGEYAQRLLTFNDRTYRFSSNSIKELYNGNYSNEVFYGNINFNNISVYSNQVYALIDDYEAEDYSRKVVKINLESDIVNSLGSSSEYIDLDYTHGENHNYIYHASFDNLGNLALLNQDVNNQYGIYSYQLFPEIFIAAGGTEGTFTFESLEDVSFEDDETIIVTPGEALNATISSDEPLVLTIIDDDLPPAITFELSSETIQESSEVSVTLTATTDIASGYELTIPFSLTGDAIPYSLVDGNIDPETEYVVLDSEGEVTSSIVIAPSSTTGSVTISTFGYDDLEVEQAESIIFNFGEIENATTDTESISLSLLSEDNATITQVQAEENVLTEGESTNITVTINSAQSNDVYLPVIFGGSASVELDYSTVFAAQGEQSLIGELPFTGFSRHGILSDGRQVFLNNGQLMVVAEDASYYNTADLGGEHYQYMVIENDIIYIANDNRMSTVDITNISSNQVEREDFVVLDNLNLNGYNFSVENGVIVYGVYVMGTSTRQVWRMDSVDSTPELIGSSLDCCYKPVQIDGNIYRLETWGYRQLFEDGTEGEYINYNGYTGGVNRDRQIVIKNGILYGFAYSGDNDGELTQIDLTAGTGETSQAFNIQISEDITATRSFEFAPNGNILLINETTDENEYVVQINSYLVATEIKVDAGETSGSITINTIDDSSYEFDETITVNYGTPTNADIGDISASEITILDNDPAPSVTFEFSSETISENSIEDVTLTATLSEVSGYEVTVPFTISDASTATLTDEYTVSGLVITIPANSQSANLSVSTTDLDDEDVEMLESIIFVIGEVSNASLEEGQATELTLLLDSDDNPNLISVTAEPLEFAEHESSIVTATIDEATSRDVIIPFNISGTATFGSDYSVTWDSEGDETTLFNSNDFQNIKVLEDGRIIGVNCNVISFYELDGSFTNLYEPTGNCIQYFDIIDNNNIVYTLNSEVFRFDLNTSESTSLYEIQQGYFEDLRYANDKIYVMWRNDSGVMSFESLSEGEDPVVYGTFGGYPGDGLNMLLVNSEEEFFGLRSDGIWKLVDGELLHVAYVNNGNLESAMFKNDVLYVKVYNYNTNDWEIGSVANLEPNPDNVPILNVQSLNYEITNTNGNNFGIPSFVIGNSGELILSLSIPGENSSIRTYNNSPEVMISAGNLTGSLEITGIEDDLNAPGQETDETIILDVLEAANANSDSENPIPDVTLTILNNEISLNIDELALEGIPALTDSSIAWGDYDRDGDQDLAVMGRNFFTGVTTALYTNNDGVFVNTTPGVFAPHYQGDIMWVDYNKDGFIDLVVSGLDPNLEASTIIYENINGVTFTPSSDLALPPLFSTSMSSGDLDNDGDIDFVINGMDDNDEWKKYIYKRQGAALVLEEDYQNQFEGDTGINQGVMRIADYKLDGDLDLFMLGQSSSRVKDNSYIADDQFNGDSYLNSYSGASMTIFGDAAYYMGINENDSQSPTLRIFNLENGNNDVTNIEGLKNGDIAIGDYNNDGVEDMVVTGESEDGSAVTRLYNGSRMDEMTSAGNISFTENTNIELVGLRNSTAKWVDYDLDGDLDLFITGANDDGEFSLLYKTELLNKTNQPAQAITGLAFESLGNGKVLLSWDEPEDDFSDELSYVIMLGTSPLGSELSNTESNIFTGQRLITKSPQINTNSYEILLDPGDYYWTVQSVDTGLMGSEFAEESSFQLTYEWKLLNQGGIIDRSISSVEEPIVKLTDIDGDNDMDLVYGSRSNNSDIQIFRLGDTSFEYFDNVSDTRNITDIEFLDINNDLILDILVNTWDSNSNNSLRLYNSTSSGGFNLTFDAPGLFDAKVELIDINNDGTEEIIHAGRTSASSNSELKIFVYEQNGNSLSNESIDISDQVSGLGQGAFGFGNVDDDEDIDFAITGLSNFGAQSKLYFNETVFTETVAPIFELSNVDFPAAYDSTLDLVDFDADGDLDMVLSGLSPTPTFKVFANNGLSGEALSFDEVQNTQLVPIRNANIDYGDYNGDGYLDILYTGTVTGQGEVTKLVEFDPNSQSYIESDFDLSDIVNASIAFGDVDGDNDLDFTIAGESASNNNQSIIKTYLNVRNESAGVIASGSDLTESFSDATEFIVNDRPSTPDGLTTEILSYDSETDRHEVKFIWNSAEDDHTPTEGLSYALKIGTSNGASDIMKVNALGNGYRLSAGKGNVEQNREWILSLPEDTYFWSVQAIDASYSGSYFSETDVFDIAGSANITIMSPENNATYPLGTDSVDIEFEVINFALSDDSSGDGYVIWTINGQEQEPLYSTESISIDVEDDQSSYLIEMELVDNNGDSLPEPALTSINIYILDDTQTAKLALQGIIDFTTPQGGQTGKAIHLLVGNQPISDLSIYGLGVANNGGGTDGQEYTFPPISVEPNAHILLARDPAGLNQYMITDNWDYVLEADSTIAQNGDDAIELFENGEVIETYGDVDTDGTGEEWEYLDSWAYKTFENGEFTWTTAPINSTDDTQTICDSDYPYPFIDCDITEVYYDVTFSVNTLTIEDGVGPNGMYLGGGIFGGADAYQMSDDDGDGTWSVTLSLEEGTSGNYIFLNSPNDSGDWGAKEDLSGQECSDPDNFNDRILEPVDSDKNLLHCFGTCDTDGSCDTFSNTDVDLFEMTLYPNPTDVGFVTIKTPVYGVKHVKVFDITGKRLISKSLTGDTLDVSSMSSGVYFVSVNVNGFNKIVKLIIK